MAAISNDRLVARTPFFYGWIILVIGTLGLILSSPGQTYSVSIFIEYFITDFGISRSLVSTLYTVGTLISASLLPSIGRKIDQRGSRLTMAVIVVALGLASVYMGSVQNAWMLLAGFVAIRLAGQGSLSLVSSNVINQWWIRRRGMATAVSGLGVSLLGVGGFPSLITWLIGLYGWRTSYALLGVGVVVILLPLTAIFIRNTPEAVGLAPDGIADDAPTPAVARTTPGQPRRALEENWTRAEAVRTSAFWMMSLGSLAIAMLTTGLYFHLISIFADNGFSAETAALVFLPAALSTAVLNVIGGLLSDRLPANILMSGALLMQVGSLLLAPILSSTALVILYGIMLGGGAGLSRAVTTVVWPNYFGRRHLGSIAGLATTLLVFGAALGPMPIGIARDLLGSYNAVLWGFALFPLVLALLVIPLGKRPVRGSAESTA